jgi:hypothetical protein
MTEVYRVDPAGVAQVRAVFVRGARRADAVSGE